MPSFPIVLVNTILINIPKILVINPPIINIIVDLINLFFILKYMKRCIKKEIKINTIIGDKMDKNRYKEATLVDKFKFALRKCIK